MIIYFLYSFLTFSLLVVVMLYVLAFKKYKYVPYRIGLTIWLLPFIILNFFTLMPLWCTNLKIDTWQFIKSLPFIRLFMDPERTADIFLLPLEYFAVCGLIAFISSSIIKFLLKPNKVYE